MVGSPPPSRCQQIINGVVYSHSRDVTSLFFLPLSLSSPPPPPPLLRQVKREKERTRNGEEERTNRGRLLPSFLVSRPLPSRDPDSDRDLDRNGRFTCSCSRSIGLGSNTSLLEARIYDLPELGFDLSWSDPVSWIYRVLRSVCPVVSEHVIIVSLIRFLIY